MAGEITGQSLDQPAVTINKVYGVGMGLKKGMRARINKRRVHPSYLKKLNK